MSSEQLQEVLKDMDSQQLADALKSMSKEQLGEALKNLTKEQLREALKNMTAEEIEALKKTGKLDGRWISISLVLSELWDRLGKSDCEKYVGILIIILIKLIPTC